IRTGAVPMRYIPIAFADAIVRSRFLSGTNGPRSLIRIADDCRVVRFVTTISDPIGSVRCAAVSASSRNTCPFAALRPLYGAVYQVAAPVSLKIGLCDRTNSWSSVLMPPSGNSVTGILALEAPDDDPSPDDAGCAIGGAVAGTLAAFCLWPHPTTSTTDTNHAQQHSLKLEAC